MNRNVLISVTVCLVALVVFLSLQVYYYDQFIDDAYISFRYARNLARGVGLCFNPGEAVEGYSNFSWVVLLAVGIRMGGDVQLMAKFFGGLFGALCLAGTFLLVMAASQDKKRKMRMILPASLSALLLSANTYHVYWSSLGLETSLFAFFLVMSFGLQLYELEHDKKIPLSAFFFTLVFLSRPEGIYYFFPLCAVRGWRLLRLKKLRRIDLLWFGWIALTFLGHLIWKIGIYGRFHPNTYYAKAPPAFLAEHTMARKYLAGWVMGANGTNILILLFSLITGCYYLRHKVLTFLLPLFSVFLFTWLVDGDWMGNYRFLVPAMPFMYALAAIGTWRLLEDLKMRNTTICWITGATLFLIIGCHIILQLQIRHDGRYLGEEFVSQKEKGWFLKLKSAVDHGFNPPLQKETEFFLSVTRKSDLILFPDIGFLGYTSRCRIIDSRGLMDKAAADFLFARTKERGIDKAHQNFLHHFFEDPPAIAALVLRKKDGRGDHLIDETLKESERFQSQYREIKRLPYYSNTELVIYSDKNWRGSPEEEIIFERFRTALNENPYIARFYMTFIKILSVKGKKAEARKYYDEFSSRFPALVSSK